MNTQRRTWKRPLLSAESLTPGFQIAPMIDVVFVIMLFFMVMAGAVKAERHLSQRLPGGIVEPRKDLVFPMEVSVGIEGSGAVLLNDEVLDDGRSKRLSALVSNLLRLRSQCDVEGNKVLVTIDADPDASYERMIDVLNALAECQITDVTMSVGSID